MDAVADRPDPRLLYEASRRSAGVAYVLLFSLGALGAHRFYLVRKTSGLALICVTLVGLIGLANESAPVAYVSLFVLLTWLAIDIWMLPGMVRSYNLELVGVLTRPYDPRRALRPAERPTVGSRAVDALLLLRESRVATIGIAICLFWVLVALLAPLLAPFDPLEIIEPLASPGTELERGTLWLGADFLGRDVLSRVIHGSRTVMIWAPIATVSAYAVGVLLGLLGGYLGGWVDDAISFVANLILAFPVLVLLILIISLLGPSGLSIVIAVTFASAPAVFRIVRGEVLGIRARDFIGAAKTRGESIPYILFAEILPNARGPLIVDACLRMGYTTITIGILGFLGLGFPPPTPDWGGMINENRAMALTFPHMTVFPVLALSSLVLGLNLVSDGIRELSQRH